MSSKWIFIFSAFALFILSDAAKSKRCTTDEDCKNVMCGDNDKPKCSPIISGRKYCGCPCDTENKCTFKKCSKPTECRKQPNDPQAFCWCKKA